MCRQRDGLADQADPIRAMLPASPALAARFPPLSTFPATRPPSSPPYIGLPVLHRVASAENALTVDESAFVQCGCFAKPACLGVDVCEVA
jgi:hypothetical protein